MKKVLCVLFSLLFIISFMTACNGINNALGTSSSSSGTKSSASEASKNSSRSTSGSDSQMIDGSNSGQDGKGYLLDDFSSAYKNAGFDVSNSTYGDSKLNSIRVKLKDAIDDIYYEIISFKNPDEAKAEMRRINDSGKKSAYVNGNALVIGEKDYSEHDRYIAPFNSVK